MKHMSTARIHIRQNNAMGWIDIVFYQAMLREQIVVGLGSFPALLVPAFYMAELYQQDGGLQGIKPAVPSDFFVKIALPHAVGTQDSRPVRQMRVPGGDCLLYTSDAADDLLCVDLGGRRILK